MIDEVDFESVNKRYESSQRLLQSLDIPEENKRLSKEFLDSCALGLYGKKIGKPRLVRTSYSLISLNRLLPDGKQWHDITKLDIKALLMKIEESSWGEWERYTTLSILRKFMAWIRSEHSYPQNYPDKEKFVNLMSLMDYAPEAKFKIAEVRKLKPLNEIPTAEEILWMMQACDTYEDKRRGARDKAIISILGEIGARIGGIGILKLKDIIFDSLGALIMIHDKTMVGEPVRIIKAAPYLIAWIEVHPLKANPEAPLWVNFGRKSGQRYKRVGMDYFGMRKALKTAKETHNALAESKGLPLITRRIHFHAFRYHAQVRDTLEGMPIAIQCKQRGWSPTSKQPQRYARISSAQVDEWLATHYGLNKPDIEPQGALEKKEPFDRQPAPSRQLPGYS